MLAPVDSANSDQEAIIKSKRPSSVLSPPDKECKKSKMAANVDNKGTPDWVSKIPTLEAIKQVNTEVMDEFKKECFEPFKAEVLGRISKVEKDLEKVPDSIKNVRDELARSIEFTNNQVKTMDSRISTANADGSRRDTRINQLFDMIREERSERIKLKNKVVELEDRSRRDNLVVEGLSDEQNEKPADIETKTRTFFKDKLNIDTANKIVMGRCHRMGPYQAGKARPTIVKFDLTQQRARVWNKGMKLAANSGYKVKENISKESESAKRQLFPFMKAARALNYYARIEGNKLVVRSREKDINITCTVDSLHLLPEELSPSALFTPVKNGVTLFYTRNSPHSNFHECVFTENGNTFYSNEQYIKYRHAIAKGDYKLARRILGMVDPADIKELCKKAFLTMDEDIKQSHVKAGMLLKYSQNPDLKEDLRKTIGTTLAEANPFDTYWGIGLKLWYDDSFDQDNWKGSNHCGNLLMEVRDILFPPPSAS